MLHLMRSNASAIMCLYEWPLEVCVWAAVIVEQGLVGSVKRPVNVNQRDQVNEACTFILIERAHSGCWNYSRSCITFFCTVVCRRCSLFTRVFVVRKRQYWILNHQSNFEPPFDLWTKKFIYRDQIKFCHFCLFFSGIFSFIVQVLIERLFVTSEALCKVSLEMKCRWRVYEQHPHSLFVCLPLSSVCDQIREMWDPVFLSYSAVIILSFCWKRVIAFIICCLHLYLFPSFPFFSWEPLWSQQGW